MAEGEKYRLIWTIMQYETYEMAPSRVKKREEAKAKKEPLQLKRKAQEEAAETASKAQRRV